MLKGSSNPNLNLNIEQREIHPLAEAEANLKMAISFCNQCQKIYENMGILQKFFKPEKYLESKNHAMEYAGKAIQNLRNYEINPPSEEKGIHLYRMLRPAVVSLTQPLNQLRYPEKLKEAIKDYFAKHAGVSYKEEEGLVFRALEIFIDEVSEDAFGTLVEEGLEYVGKIVEKIDRRKLLEALEESRKNLYQAPTVDIKPLRVFLTLCSNREKPHPSTCSVIRENLTKVEKELFDVLNKRRVLDEDIRNATSFLYDVSIGILEIMTDEEFAALKEVVNLFSKKKR